MYCVIDNGVKKINHKMMEKNNIYF